jgi:hypothetical protein
VKLLDVNIVLPSHRQDHPDHPTARAWLDRLFERGDQFGVPWQVWWSFLRLSTHHRVFRVPTPLGEAFDYIRAVRSQPGHVSVEPGPGHARHLDDVCRSGEVVADLVPDAVLAALAVEHDGEIVSFDRDFARFPGLRWHQPE